MIFRYGVCLQLPLFLVDMILCFICSSLSNGLLFMFKGMLGSCILIRTVIMASMFFTHTRTSLLSTIKIRWANCLDLCYFAGCSWSAIFRCISFADHSCESHSWWPKAFRSREIFGHDLFCQMDSHQYHF
jgi:hypothetical protein